MNIDGADLVTGIFGCWPSFHDAEVIRFELERGHPRAQGPDLCTDVHVFEMTSEVSPDGYYVLRHHTLVSFRFRGVQKLSLSGWNHQNVLSGLRIDDIRGRQPDGLTYEVVFQGTFGLQADFMCRSAQVESVRPWDPDQVDR